MLLCHYYRCSRSIISRCLYVLSATDRDICAREHRAITVIATLSPLSRLMRPPLQYLFSVTSSIYWYYRASSISYGLKKHYRADCLEILRFYLWRGYLVFLLYKLPRIMQLTWINLDKTLTHVSSTRSISIIHSVCIFNYLYHIKNDEKRFNATKKNVGKFQKNK